MLDIDFHHGNGTQDIFYERGDGLIVSVHGHPDHSYPYFSDFEDETGAGRGVGCNRNFPLAPGTFELVPGEMRKIGARLAFGSRPLLVIQEGGYNVRNIRRRSSAFFRGCAEALPPA